MLLLFILGSLSTSSGIRRSGITEFEFVRLTPKPPARAVAPAAIDIGSTVSQGHPLTQVVLTQMLPSSFAAW